MSMNVMKTIWCDTVLLIIGAGEFRGGRALSGLGQPGGLPRKAGSSWMGRVFLGTEEGNEHFH